MKIFPFICYSILCSAIALFTFCTPILANAKEINPPQKPIVWEMSMMPKPSAEEIEASRWSIITENDLGIYAYDMESLAFSLDENNIYDKNTVNVLVKTLFLDNKVLKKLKNDYKEKLNAKEHVLYCKMDMQYKMKEKTYTVKTMAVFTNTDRQIDVKNNKNQFAPIPEKSFAEALYEVCQKFVLDVETMEQSIKENASKEAEKIVEEEK